MIFSSLFLTVYVLLGTSYPTYTYLYHNTIIINNKKRSINNKINMIKPMPSSLYYRNALSVSIRPKSASPVIEQISSISRTVGFC